MVLFDRLGHSVMTRYCRIYQFVFRVLLKVIPIRIPKHLEGVRVCLRLPGYLVRRRIRRVLVVTNHEVMDIPLMKEFMKSMKKHGLACMVYDNTVPNPTTRNVEEAYELYKMHALEAIIAVGGGSAMDCAKAVAVRVVKPHKSLQMSAGVLKVHRKLPALYAIPTTAGTGSEVTVAAVISDEETGTKFEIMDPVLVPKHAILDAEFTRGLPKHLTATTGLDALSHAVEAYIGRSNTKISSKAASNAVRLIRYNLLLAYQDGSNMEARTNMLRASHYAGVAFTRAYVGYIHALAHAVGGMYHLPHGLVIAIIMPYVLEYYGKAIDTELAELADYAQLTREEDTVSEKATRFLTWLHNINHKMEIPEKINVLFKEDISELVELAYKEANPLYPVPVVLSRDDLSAILELML